jgi:hypothetical protein
MDVDECLTLLWACIVLAAKIGCGYVALHFIIKYW